MPRKKTRRPRCPGCTDPLVPLVFGMPGPGLEGRAERGEVILAGCMVPRRAPTHRCPDCDRDFIVERENIMPLAGD